MANNKDAAIKRNKDKLFDKEVGSFIRRNKSIQHSIYDKEKKLGLNDNVKRKEWYSKSSVADGGSCIFNWHCKSGRCAIGTCKSKNLDGWSCAYSYQCQSDLCANFKCQRLRETAENCQRDYECKSKCCVKVGTDENTSTIIGLFLGKGKSIVVCDFKKGRGESCTKHSDCCRDMSCGRSNTCAYTH